jgi:hypothetical protein
MIYVLNTETECRAIESKEAADRKWLNVECRRDWNSMEQAADVARKLSDASGELYLATDSGEWCLPRYDVIRAPKVGDAVSYSFNGDSYPCGHIAKISDSMKLITTTDGKKFYRRKLSGSWVRNSTWSLIQGHHREQNPSF